MIINDIIFTQYLWTECEHIWSWYDVLQFLLLIQYTFRANALITDDEIHVTKDGTIMDTVLNGVTDLSQFEKLVVNIAYKMNPSGSSIAFAQFNDTLVPIVQYPMYGHPEQSSSGKYPFLKWV